MQIEQTFQSNPTSVIVKALHRGADTQALLAAAKKLDAYHARRRIKNKAARQARKRTRAQQRR